MTSIRATEAMNMLGLFKTEPLIDEPTAQWLFDTFAWAQRNFDAEVFKNETVLVIPSNAFFPGRENSVQGMARLMFEHAKKYAGMSHWPLRLADGRTCSSAPAPVISMDGALRGTHATLSEAVAVAEAEQIGVDYDPNMVGNPEGLIASFAHTLAHYLGQSATEVPPGGVENWPQITEVLAVFLGFGLMFANSAFNVRTASCGSCGKAAADRRSYLSQYDTTYALAIFCTLKNIPAKAVLPHLKSSLRGHLKKSLKDIQKRQQAVPRLAQA